jgi:hypothetical protein
MVCASAQVTVQVTQEQERFLPGEALKVAVRITNLSGQELHLGAEEDWLTFAIESREGVVVPKLAEAPVVGEFVLGSSKVAIKRVDLAPYFSLTQPGNYQIVATVRIRAWNRELTSEPKSFDVIQGVKLWEQEVGVPKTGPATNSEPEMRRYVLQQANYLRGQICLYLRVTDAYGKPIRVFALGPMVSFGQPEPRVDRLSHLHLLYQNGPFSFNYTVCDLQGEVVTRQTYDYAESRPHLRTDDEGNISVAGGTRRPTTADVPTPNSDAATDMPEPLLPGKSASLTNQLSVTRPAH